MKPFGRILPLLCSLAALLALPAGAAAQGRSFISEGQRSADAHLAGTHGYRLTISAESGSVTVTAEKGTASVRYFSFASQLDGDRIEARLPGVGHLHLRFHERSRSYRRPSDKCRGPATLIRKGVFVGSVKIRGERDYTSAESQHVRGEIIREPRTVCRQRATARASSGGNAYLNAMTDRGNGSLSFAAFAFSSTRSQTDLGFIASLLQVRGQMVIWSTQTVIDKDSSDLEIAVPPRSATVGPPKPFTGNATFQQEAKDQFSWTGDLGVELPGLGEVSLAGPKFETALCLGRRCRGDAELTEGSTIVAGILPRAAAPTPSPWRWPGSPR